MRLLIKQILKEVLARLNYLAIQVLTGILVPLIIRRLKLWVWRRKPLYSWSLSHIGEQPMNKIKERITDLVLRTLATALGVVIGYFIIKAFGLWEVFPKWQRSLTSDEKVWPRCSKGWVPQSVVISTSSTTSCSKSWRRGVVLWEDQKAQKTKNHRKNEKRVICTVCLHNLKMTLK